jgi:hypothetical protein
MDFITGLPLV